MTPILFVPQEVSMGLSVPVAFQLPKPAALLGLTPLGYFLSLGVKKYHSSSPNKAFSVRKKKNNEIHLVIHYQYVRNTKKKKKKKKLIYNCMVLDTDLEAPMGYIYTDLFQL